MLCTFLQQIRLRCREWVATHGRSGENRDIFFFSKSLLTFSSHSSTQSSVSRGDKTAAPRANSFVDPRDTEDWVEECEEDSELGLLHAHTHDTQSYDMMES